jgi:hypothetical protein
VVYILWVLVDVLDHDDDHLAERDFAGVADVVRRKEHSQTIWHSPARPSRQSMQTICSLEGPADFDIFEPTSGEPALIECKNHREWIYRASERMKSLVGKAIAADMTPIIVARRLPYITKKALCEPAGITSASHARLLPA